MRAYSQPAQSAAALMFGSGRAGIYNGPLVVQIMRSTKGHAEWRSKYNVRLRSASLQSSFNAIDIVQKAKVVHVGWFQVACIVLSRQPCRFFDDNIKDCLIRGKLPRTSIGYHNQELHIARICNNWLINAKVNERDREELTL